MTKETTMTSVAEGISYMKGRICCKRVLLILDGVDKIDALAGALVREVDHHYNNKKVTTLEDLEARGFFKKYAPGTET